MHGVIFNINAREPSSAIGDVELEEPGAPGLKVSCLFQCCLRSGHFTADDFNCKTHEILTAAIAVGNQCCNAQGLAEGKANESAD
mmetsp:Transcript_16302/g.28516  ORF Transcript_16302/g.28516 Transcript_16302/m.28516 type:complete len:85 (-) Transcript_16302:1971-2225(-)